MASHPKEAPEQIHIQCGGHDDYLQIWPLWLGASNQPEKDVRVEAALVGLQPGRGKNGQMVIREHHPRGFQLEAIGKQK